MIRRAALLLLLAGCARPAPLEGEVPADVRWISVLTGENGALRGSPPVEWTPGQGLPIYTTAGTITRIAGWTEAQLREAGGSAGLIARDPLREVSGCSPSLPPPSWSVTWTGDDVLEPGPPLPPLGAAWLDETCPAATRDTLAIDADTECQLQRCAPEPARKLATCVFELDLDRCALGTVRVTQHPDGALCVEPLGGLCEAAPARHGDAALRCGSAGCNTELYVHREAPLELVTRRLSLLDVAPRVPVWADNIRLEISWTALGDGYAGELIESGGALWIATHDGAWAERCADVAGAPGRWITVDPERFELTGTATSPPCVSAAAATASGALALFAEAGRWWIGRFDTALRLVQRAPAAGPPDGLSIHAWRPIASIVRDGVLTTGFAAEGEGGLVHRYDAATLDPLSRTHFGTGRLTNLLPAPDGALVLIDGKSRSVRWFDPVASSTITRVQLEQRDQRGFDTLLGAAITADGRVLVAGTFHPAVYVLADRGPLLHSAVIFDREIDPFAIAPWGPDERQALVLGSARSPGRFLVTASLLDLERGRFLPRHAEAGSGVATRILARNGEVWALLPWSSELLKISPR